MDRKIVIDTASKKGQLFKVTEYSGRFTAYRVRVMPFWNDSTKVGEARSLEDAVTIIKASVDGTVRNVKIKNW